MALPGSIGVRAVQVGHLGVLPGLLGGVRVRQAGHAAPSWPWCRAGRWLLQIPDGTAVCRRWAAVGWRCSQEGAAAQGAVGGGVLLRAGLGVVGARAWPFEGQWGSTAARIALAPGGGRQVVLGRVVVVPRVCRLRVAPCHWWVRWQGLVVVVGVSVVHMMVWCDSVRPVGWVACGLRLCLCVVMIELVGVAVVVGQRDAGVWGGRGVLVLLVVLRSLALRRRRHLWGLNL